MIELSREMTMLLIGTLGALLALLIVSFVSRPRVFTQYLHHMTGIKLSSRAVAQVFKTKGRPGVREMFLDLIIREDLRDSPRITPDTPPDTSLLAPEDRHT
jgi:hypothetical protein